MATCNDVLIDVQRLLLKYQILGETATTHGQRLKRVWKRLTLEPEDIKELRARITSTIGLVNTSITVSISVTTSTINKQVSKIDQKVSEIDAQVNKVVDTQDLEYRQALLKWISDTDHAAILADVLSRRQRGTGEWFLNNEAFQNWFNGRGSNIFVAKGDPGTGKTTMASIIIESLQSKIDTASRIGLAYFFCNFNRTSDTLTMLASILRQLLSRQPIPEDINADLRRRQLEQRPLDVEDIKAILCKISARYSKVFFILDALDECEIVHLKRVIPILLGLLDQAKVHLLVTCRPLPKIVQLFSEPTIQNLQAHTEDIEAYLQNVGQDMDLVRRRPELLILIMRAIVEAVDGMYVTSQVRVIS